MILGWVVSSGRSLATGSCNGGCDGTTIGDCASESGSTSEGKRESWGMLLGEWGSSRIS